MRRLLSVFAFILALAASGLAAPTDFDLIAPSNSSQDVDVWPLFEWETADDPGDVTYTLRVGTDPYFTGDYMEFSDLTVTSYRPEIDLVMDTLYYWKVIAVNDLGEETECTAPGSPFGFWMLQTIAPEVDRVVSGAITLVSHRTLRPENTPYTLREGDLNIPPGLRFSLQAGTTLLVDGNRYINVAGTFKALGTELAPVTIASAAPSPQAGDWKTLTFQSNADATIYDQDGVYMDGSTLQYVFLQHSGNSDAAVEIYGGSIHVDHCEFDGRLISSPRAIRIDCDGCLVSNNRIHDFSPSSGPRGILWLYGDDNRFIGNIIEGNNVTSSVHLQGAMLAAEGDHNQIVSNRIKNGTAHGNRGTLGGGLYLYGDSNQVISNEITGISVDDTSDDCVGGGVYIAAGTTNTVFRQNVISGNSTRYGGGIYDAQGGLRVRSCTITNNHATIQGGAIYNARCVLSCNIKYNTVGNIDAAGGIYANADSICYNNISNNENFDLMLFSGVDAVATYNWWFTRSDEVEIQSTIWDGYDTEGSLGFAIYQPYLTDASSTAPGRFTQVTGIQAYTDSTYTNPLNTTLDSGDTLFFRITGVDDNPYNRDVAVAEVIDWDNFQWVRPFFEESGDNTGTFDGRVLLSNATVLPDQIMVAPGDSLTVRAEISPDHWFHLLIGQPLPPTAAFTFDEGVLVAPCDVTFTNASEGTVDSVLWDFGDGETSTDYNPVHHFEAGGLYDVTLTVTGPSGTDAVTLTVTILGESPLVAAVADVPDDQGGWVYVDFLRSGHDTDPLTLAEIYTVERMDDGEWTAVGSCSAYAEAAYRVQVPTLTDSTAVDPALADYRVLASMDEGTFASAIVAGYSTDDIAPGVPTGLLAGCDGEIATLGWDAVDDDDFQFYRVYQGLTDDFPIEESTESYETSASELVVDAGCGAYFRVIALDDAGNEGEPSAAALASPTISVADGLPEALQLVGNYPNPFNPQTSIQFGLPRPTAVQLTVHDIAGRLVATLVSEDLPAGFHHVPWNGLSDAGRTVASGVYVARLKANDDVKTCRMTLLK